MRRWSTIRDVLLFVGGLAGVVHETVGSAPERPTLLLLYAAMMGLPALFRSELSDRDRDRDDRRRRR